jgi:hypothetical protein
MVYKTKGKTNRSCDLAIALLVSLDQCFLLGEKFQPEIYDFHLYKSIFREKMAQIARF